MNNLRRSTIQSNELIPTVTAELPAVEELAARFSGQLIRPGDDAYEQAHRLWNGRIDRHPALIAGCHTAQDVVLAVET